METYKIVGSAYKVESTPKNTWKKVLRENKNGGLIKTFNYGTLQYDLCNPLMSQRALKHVFELDSEAIEDNPVPSLDKNDIEYLQWINKPKNYGYCKKLESIISKLQNGVETDKEELVKLKCSCKIPHYGYKYIQICTSCEGIKDDKYWRRISS